MYCKHKFSTFSQPQTAERHQDFIPEKVITYILVHERKNGEKLIKIYLFSHGYSTSSYTYRTRSPTNRARLLTALTKKLTKSGFHCIQESAKTKSLVIEYMFLVKLCQFPLFRSFLLPSSFSWKG